MKQKLTLRRVLASAVAALAAAAAVWLLCRWVGYDLQLRIGNEPVYEIANDDYTQIIDVPEDGLWQAVPLEAGQTLYGCRLRFSTHGELYRAGMVMVDLCDADGTILREAAGNYANIFDDNFTGFAFGTAYTAAQAETLCLHIYNVVEWEGPLGLWASTGTVGALSLTADGVDADATLALQYMTDDTGSWPSDLANGLAPDQLLMTNPNGDSIWTFSLGYICRNLPATAKLLLRTIPAQGALWLQGILGTTLGEPIVYRIDVSWLLGVGLVLALLAAALPVQDEPDEPLLGRRTGFGVLGIILCVAVASLVVALNWTPINYETLFGMQGRYWLPVLPLALLLVKGNRSVCARRDLSRGAALAVTACTLLTLLQGYSLYASWQPVS